MTTDEEATLARALGRMEGKVDLLLLHFEDMKSKVDAHDTRLQALERDLQAAKNYAYAGAAGISLAATAALKLFGLA